MKALALVIVAFAFWKNIEAERRPPENMNVAETWLHTLLFIARITPTILVRRLLGFKSKTSNWNFFEDLAMRTVRFHGKLGDVHVPNVFLNGLSALARIASKFDGLVIEDISADRLGFGPNSSGRQKFGKGIECTAHWMTLTSDIPFGTSDVIVKFYIHGGGFCVGNSLMYLAAHTKFLREMREQGVTNVAVLSIEYPLAPKVKFPIPIETCFHVYDHLVREKQIIKPENIILAGDSAGGSIALNIGLRATRWGCAGIGLISPWVAHELNTISQHENKDIDLIGGAQLIEKYQDAHVIGGKEKSLELESLEFLKNEVPFSVLPPIWLSVGEFEVFKDDILHLAKTLESHDVPISLHFANEVPHIYPMLWPLFYKQSSKALQDFSQFCAERTSKAKLENQRLLGNSNQSQQVSKLKKVLSSTDISNQVFQNLLKEIV